MTESFRLIALCIAFITAGVLSATADERVPTFPDDRDANGNRFLAHDLPLDAMAYRTYRLERPIVWAGGAITPDGPVWHLRTADGQTTRLRIPVDRNGFPGLAVMESIDAPSPAPLARAGAAGLKQPLPDGQPAVTRDGDLVYLSGPTTAYPHGILGDPVEASRVVILPADGSDEVVIELSPQVAEERGVLLVDLDDDGREEIVTVLADASEGARLAAFTLGGDVFATGEPIGVGYRWRHLIGAGPLGPDGEQMIAVVRTPHIGGVLEYYDVNLDVFAAIPGFSSHAIGSPNLGDAVVANVDGGESWEIVLPDQRRSRLSAVSLTRQGPRTVWSYDLGARLSGNISSMSTPEMAAMLVPTRDGTLHIWTTRRR